MKNFKKLNGILLSAVIGSGAGFNSQAASAWEYNYRVEVPYIYEGGKEHKVFIPFDVNAPDHEKIRNVSWDWKAGIQRYEVKLCNMLWDRCKDISAMRVGSTRQFNYAGASMPFYFIFKGVGRPFNPEGGIKGGIKVEW